MSEVTKIPEKEVNRIILSFSVFNISTDYQNLILDAINALNSGKYIYDGATGDGEWWSSIYEPASLVHDYLWRTGMGGPTSDKIFLKLMLMYKIPNAYVYTRYFIVRLGWVLYYYWVHKSKGNIKPINPKYKKLI